MVTTAHLPHDWQPDHSLQHVIPPPHDYRTFKRLRENSGRYAACIVGSGIFDTHDHRFLSLCSNGKKSNRRLYRLNLGPHTKPVRRFYARIICTLVHGDPPGPDYEAHHRVGGPREDHWANLAWQTGKQNRAIEVERQAQKRRTGATNGRTKLVNGSLSLLIYKLDDDIRSGRDPDIARYARFFDVSKRQIQRIIAGDSRKDEVDEIRRYRAEEARENSTARTGNMFFDAE